MSSHYIYIRCSTCPENDMIYTGNLTTEAFDDNDWEGETIMVQCKACKAGGTE